jgi:hypothetical protein
MKFISKNIAGLALVGLSVTSLLSGCAKQLDINTNPNEAVQSNVDPYLILPGTLSTTAANVNTGYGFLGRWMGFIATAAGIAPSAEEESYNITNGFNTGAFNTPLDINEDLQFMENKAKATNQTFYVAAAKIIKSFNFARVVDAYNSIPYSQALQGLTFITPKYDDPKAIYEDLIVQIDSAIGLIKTYDLAANPNLKTVDIMYGTEIGTNTNAHKTAWIKLANTIKLRLLMHQSAMPDRQAYIRTEIAKIVAENSGFLESGKSATVSPGYSQSQPNPYYAAYGFTIAGQDATSTRANNFLLNTLKVDGDPRVTLIYKPILTTVPAGAAEPTPTLDPKNYRGNDYGLATDNSVHKYQTSNYVSRVGGINAAGAVASANQGLIKGWDMRGWIMTSIESLFLQAEAIQRGYLTGSAEAVYKSAVQESFIWLNAGGTTATAMAAFNTYYNASLTKPNVSWTTAPDKLKLIAYQKYIAMVPLDAEETWTDYRRNGGYPAVQLSQNTGRTSQVLPVRLLYTNGELNNNLKNVPTVGRNSGAQFSDKIFWMP